MKKGFEFGDMSVKFDHPATAEKRGQILSGSQSHSSTSKDNKEQNV
ncbi:MAG TPA: hypothetical protein VK431_01235 [Nitrosopumilaceae archaeon]|nr:hypothetical protein [Nitrosopumilaceae archaeon]